MFTTTKQEKVAAVQTQLFTAVAAAPTRVVANARVGQTNTVSRQTTMRAAAPRASVPVSGKAASFSSKVQPSMAGLKMSGAGLSAAAPQQVRALGHQAPTARMGGFKSSNNYNVQNNAQGSSSSWGQVSMSMGNTQSYMNGLQNLKNMSKGAKFDSIKTQAA